MRLLFPEELKISLDIYCDFQGLWDMLNGFLELAINYYRQLKVQNQNYFF